MTVTAVVEYRALDGMPVAEVVLAGMDDVVARVFHPDDWPGIAESVAALYNKAISDWPGR